MPKISQSRLDARRRGIVQAAARCLQRNGLQATGMRDLFRAANLSPGAVYGYFAGKEELLAAVAAASPSVAEAALVAAQPAAEPAHTLRRMAAAAARGLAPARLQLELETAALGSPAIAAALAERRQTAERELSQALGEAGGEAARLALTVIEGLARRRLLEPTADLAAEATAAARLLVAALGRSPSASVGRPG